MSENNHFSPTTQRRIEQIKPLLAQGMTQHQIGEAVGVSRDSVARIMGVWTKTRDFEEWLRVAWLDKYLKVDDRTAFKALTRLLSATLTRRVEAHSVEEIREIKLVWIKDEPHTPNPLPTSPGAVAVPREPSEV
jgi:hypothetical protein